MPAGACCLQRPDGGRQQGPMVASEARLMLGETAASVFGFDTAALAPLADKFGPTPDQILTPPTEDLFPRGDVHKPLSGTTIF
jgi:hypothetical protein